MVLILAVHRFSCGAAIGFRKPDLTNKYPQVRWPRLSETIASSGPRGATLTDPMTDQRRDPPPDEDFASMFAASERQGKQGRRPALAIGDKVRGKVVSVGQ